MINIQTNIFFFCFFVVLEIWLFEEQEVHIFKFQILIETMADRIKRLSLTLLPLPEAQKARNLRKKFKKIKYVKPGIDNE